MQAEHALQAFGQRTLARTFLADQDKRNFGLPVGVLDRPCNPADDVVRELSIATSDDGFDTQWSHLMPHDATPGDPLQTPSDVISDDITIPAMDGYALAATLFLPRGAKRNAVVISSATATPRRVYRGFASYLAHCGFAVLTYDYRGIGGSRGLSVEGHNRPKSLVGFKASMADWAMLDATAAVGWMRERYRELPLAYVGHSFGGQTLGLLPNNNEVSRALFVAAQAGYWKLMASPERYRVAGFMSLVGAPLTYLLGYAPGRAGIGEDLPRDVFLQWTKWVMSPHYLFDDTALAGLQNFPNFKGSLRALTFTDDPWATLPAVELLCKGLTGTSAEIIPVNPADLGIKKIGHFGFFRPDHRDTLWRGTAEWLAGE
jgi:predicted alpha/beta hydrolase